MTHPRFLSFSRNGRHGYGLAVDGGVVDLSARHGATWPTLREVIEAGRLVQLAEEVRSSKPDFALDDIRFEIPIPAPEKIICVGVNFPDRNEEYKDGQAAPSNPSLFIRFPRSFTGHEQPLIRPPESPQLDYEGELAVIIGKKARHVKEADAFSIVAGYSCYNDGSVRDWQNHTHQWAPGKNFPKTGGFGPWMVTRDEIPNVDELTLTTRLNGQVVQQTGIDLMLFPIPVVIAYITTFTELNPGDVISTGTPGGVGFKRNPQLFMKAGDKVEVDISKIGVLENPITAEA